MSHDNSLTPEEVAEILKIKRHTVYEMVKRGDLPAFRIGRKLRINPADLDRYRQQDPPPVHLSKKGSIPNAVLRLDAEPQRDKSELIICGQDTILDILGRQIENRSGQVRVLRKHVGSFAGLLALYQGSADIAAAHLMDGDSVSYNLSYARYLLPGIPVVIIHLAYRQQGFYVSEGNPYHINDWTDLTNKNLRFINREPGCGTRVLLDEKLRQLQIERRSINGYDDVATSHLAVASAVARGAANVGLGIQKAALQVRGIDFIPLQKEPYELLIRHDDLNLPIIQQVIEIINSVNFKNEVVGLGDYDLSMIGKTTYVT